MKKFKLILKCFCESLMDLTLIGLIFIPWSFVPFPYNYIGGGVALLFALTAGTYEKEVLTRRINE